MKKALFINKLALLLYIGFGATLSLVTILIFPRPLDTIERQVGMGLLTLVSLFAWSLFANICGTPSKDLKNW
jgi:hypothetical protein